MTNLYAHRDRDKHNFHAEMRLFLAMLLLSGYNVLPRRRMYWENSEDVKNDSMSRAMSRNRFEEILSVLHCCDNNNLNPEDKMTKVRPLYNLINERCLKYSSNLSSICVDESMLPYYGRHSSKQKIVGKQRIVAANKASKSGMESVDKTLQFPLQRQSLVNRR